jgi:hypothetical protein
MAVNEGDTHTTFNVLLTRPEIVLEEDVQYATQAERWFNDVWGKFANWGTATFISRSTWRSNESTHSIV